MKLERPFYQCEDVVQLAQSFLGKILVTNIDDRLTSGIITETEAYAGIHDRASHAYGDCHTRRTAPMYLDGGYAYVYLIYGIHSLFNIVTASVGVPHAVLIRAIIPLDGQAIMMSRRNSNSMHRLCDGPGKLTKALGIHYYDSGTSLSGERIWIEDRGIEPKPGNIVSGPRVGIEYAGEDALLPYRFIYRYRT